MNPIFIGVFALVLVISIFILVMNRSSGSSIFDRKSSKKDNEAKIKEANRRLAQNPNDPDALFTMATVYFEEENWDKAMKTYGNLTNLLTPGNTQRIDQFEVYLRFGISARKLNILDQAYKAFSAARSFRHDNFEVNYELGVLEFERKNYEKAVQLLNQARIQDPDNPAVFRCLGHALFRLKKPKVARQIRQDF